MNLDANRLNTEAFRIRRCSASMDRPEIRLLLVNASHCGMALPSLPILTAGAQLGTMKPIRLSEIRNNVTSSARKPSSKSKRNAAVEKQVIPGNRLTRTRLRTRQKLIEAAQVVMGRKGVEAATIAEITAEADVGFGSFYDYFKSKEEIAGVLFDRHAGELALQIEVIFARVQDQALAVSFVQRWIVERGRVDPVWGWFIIHADLALDQVEQTLRAAAKRDLERAVKAGRVTFKGVDTLVTITLAAIFAVMRRQLEGKAKPESSNELVEALLRMYGLPDSEAHRLAYMPLPAWLVDSTQSN